ncbi:MAG: hypothetical protein ACFBWO_06005 [Paracoccaceae bacterium]
MIQGVPGSDIIETRLDRLPRVGDELVTAHLALQSPPPEVARLRRRLASNREGKGLEHRLVEVWVRVLDP